MPLFTRRRHSALRNSKSAIRRPSRRPLFETLENRSLLAGFIGTPNDPEFAQQWMLNNTGQAGGVIDADIDALEAWSVTTGSMATVVAVLDSGIDYTDADLYLNIWLNEGEIPASIASNLTDADADGLISFRDLNSPANSSFVMDVNANGYIDGGDLLADSAWENGLDEDGNSRTDDLVGWDFHDNDNDPQPVVSGGIYQSHGTDQAKMIGAWVTMDWQRLASTGKCDSFPSVSARQPSSSTTSAPRPGWTTRSLPVPRSPTTVGECRAAAMTIPRRCTMPSSVRGRLGTYSLQERATMERITMSLRSILLRTASTM